MNNNLRSKLLLTCFLVIIMILSCQKPYLPPVVSSPGSYLVVEGAISGGGSMPTTIKLSNTVNLANTRISNPVTGATLVVENDQNSNLTLSEIAPGTYASSLPALDNARKYRLRIITKDKKEYLSDFVAVVNAPPIDSVSFKIVNNGVNIYSNTHDPKNITRYYRWDFQETWIIHANYFSYFKSNGDTVLSRDLVNDNIYQCWQSDTSSNIILNSSAKLTQDVIIDNPINFIKSTSEKLGTKYSILVRQYALTAEGYTFWENLKKNTEQLGSIFDAQPTQLSGNIHCITNPSEIVIGYLSAGNISSQRIFIKNSQLPTWLATPVYSDCPLDSLLYEYIPPGGKGAPINQVNENINYHKGATNPLIPVSSITPPGGRKPIGYTASYPSCVDCTLRGTNRQPSFWK